MADNEVEAMSKLADALSGLDQTTVARVLRWAAEKYGVDAAPKAAARAGTAVVADEVSDRQFGEFADLYNAANPKSGSLKAVVAGYWLQQHESQAEWDSKPANDLLKNLGHACSNITEDLTRARVKSPALVIQTRKGGKSRQARKKYKLTSAGLREVKRLITGEDASADE